MSMLKEHKWFNVNQYEEEATYLRSMHQRGWQIVQIKFPCTYIFERCEPQDVVYQLDYNQEGIQHKDEYTRMFADCGWTYLFDFVGYSYFRKPADQMQPGEDSIFCDDESRLEMMRRVLKGRLTPMLVIFAAVIVPQLLMNSAYGNSPARQALFGFYIGIFVIYVVIFIWFGLMYKEMADRVHK